MVEEKRMSHTLSHVGPVVTTKPSPTGATWLNVEPGVTIEIHSVNDCDKLIEALSKIRVELIGRKKVA